jgi:hypothetical protein
MEYVPQQMRRNFNAMQHGTDAWVIIGVGRLQEDKRINGSAHSNPNRDPPLPMGINLSPQID